MLHHAMVSDKPGGLSVQRPPPPGKSAAQVVTGQNAVNNKQYISQFWFLKLANQIKFKFCFCLILHHKAFPTVLVNIYNFFFDVVMYNEHIPLDIPFL